MRAPQPRQGVAMSVGPRRDAAAQRTVAKRGWKPTASQVLLLSLAVFFSLSPLKGIALAKGPPGGGQVCSKKNPCDTTPPAVAISAPSAGATAAGTITVAGTASDNGSV